MVKYLKLFENNSDVWEELMNETLNNDPIEELIYYVNPPSWLDNMEADEAGTSDKNLFYFIYNMNRKQPLYEHFLFRYRVEFWKLTEKKVVEQLKGIEGFIGVFLKKNDFSSLKEIADKIINGSDNLYEQKWLELEKRAHKRVKEYILGLIIKDPRLYTTYLHEYIDPYMGDMIPDWIKRGNKAGLLGMTTESFSEVDKIQRKDIYGEIQKKN